MCGRRSRDGESPGPYVCEFDPATSGLQLTASAIYHAVTDDEIVAAVGTAESAGIDQDTLAAVLVSMERPAPA